MSNRHHRQHCQKSCAAAPMHALSTTSFRRRFCPAVLVGQRRRGACSMRRSGPASRTSSSNANWPSWAAEKEHSRVAESAVLHSTAETNGSALPSSSRSITRQIHAERALQPPACSTWGTKCCTRGTKCCATPLYNLGPSWQSTAGSTYAKFKIQNFKRAAQL